VQVGIAPAALHVRAMFPAQAAYPVSHRLHDEVRLGHHVSPEHPWETLLVYVYAALYGRCRTSPHVRVRRRRMPVSGHPDHSHAYAGVLSLMAQQGLRRNDVLQRESRRLKEHAILRLSVLQRTLTHQHSYVGQRA